MENQISDQTGTDNPRSGGRGAEQKPSALKNQGTYWVSAI
jgi:hypothetical protein